MASHSKKKISKKTRKEIKEAVDSISNVLGPQVATTKQAPQDYERIA